MLSYFHDLGMVSNDGYFSDVCHLLNVVSLSLISSVIIVSIQTSQGFGRGTSHYLNLQNCRQSIALIFRLFQVRQL